MGLYPLYTLLIHNLGGNYSGSSSKVLCNGNRDVTKPVTTISMRVMGEIYAHHSYTMVRQKRVRVSAECVEMLNMVKMNDRMFDNSTPRGFVIKELARRKLADELQESGKQKVNF